MKDKYFEIYLSWCKENNLKPNEANNLNKFCEMYR